jgi:hypothetical protein
MRFITSHLPPVSTTAASNLPPVSPTQVINLPPVLTTPVENFSTDTTDVFDFGAKFATGVNDTGGNLPLPPVSRTPALNLPYALMVYSVAWGKLIHEKKLKSKISWHFPFKLGSYVHYSLTQWYKLLFCVENH